MAASKPKNSTLRPLHDVPLPATPDKLAKARKPRWGKGKEEVAGPGRVQAATASGGASEASTSANAVQDSPWPWVSITDSSASRHPAIFTKDGRWVSDVACGSQGYTYLFTATFSLSWALPLRSTLRLPARSCPRFRPPRGQRVHPKEPQGTPMSSLPPF